jgi:CrcB protein
MHDATSVRRAAGRRADTRARRWPALAAISVGGALGALARYGLAVAFPHRPGEFPWTTFGVNVAGCLLIGVLMVLVTEVWRSGRLPRLFLGVGVLGGFTTFSTYVVEAWQGVRAGAGPSAFGYLAGTLVAALVAVSAGTALTRWAIRPRTGKASP